MLLTGDGNFEVSLFYWIFCLWKEGKAKSNTSVGAAAVTAKHRSLISSAAGVHKYGIPLLPLYWPPTWHVRWVVTSSSTALVKLKMFWKCKNLFFFNNSSTSSIKWFLPKLNNTFSIRERWLSLFTSGSTIYSGNFNSTLKKNMWVSRSGSTASEFWSLTYGASKWSMSCLCIIADKRACLLTTTFQNIACKRRSNLAHGWLSQKKTIRDKTMKSTTFHTLPFINSLRTD